MVAVTGITADRAQEIEDASVVTGHIDVTTGHLILTTGDATAIDAGIARPDAAIAAAVLVETNNRIADVDAEEAARIAADNAEAATRAAAITAITKPTPLSLYDGTNFSPTNTAASATSGGAPQMEGTIVVPPTGLLKVTVQALLRASSGAGPGNGCWVGWQHRRDTVSGTIINDYNDARAIVNENVNGIITSMCVIVSDTPGAVAYFRVLHIVNSGVTGGIRSRRLIVEGV